MIFLKLLFSGALIYIAAMAIPNPIDRNLKILRCCEFDYTLSDYILPLHYKLNLNLNSNFYSNSNSTITIFIIYATQYISLHVPRSMKLLESKIKRIDSQEIKPSSYYHKDNIFVLIFVDMLLPGIYDLYVEFNFPIQKDLFIWYTNQEGYREWLFVTGIQPRRNQIFPFWNKPKLRITFDISIMHNRRYKALSNIPYDILSIRQESVYDDMMWTFFHNTSLISIDNVAFVISALNQTTNSAESISIWCRLQLISYVKFALFVAESVTMYLENYWNNAKKVLEYNLHFSEKKVNHVAIPDFQDEIKQILGFVFYREADIIYNEELDPVARKIIIARLIAREMARKYFGNLLNASYWFHLWLNEGFIMFLQAYIIDKALPDFRMMDLFVVQIQHEILDLNTYFILNSAIKYNSYRENDLHSSLSQIKGSILWRMLERTLPPDVFLKGIDRYLSNQFSNSKATSSADLWAAMQTVMNALDPKYQFKIRRIVDSWAMQNCFPVLEVMRNYSSNVVMISVQFHNELDEEQYYIPVTFTTESDPNFNKTWSDVWLTPSYSETEFSLGNNQWIIVNLQQAGYYRVSYDNENWRRIARYLNSKEYSKIHVLNRAQIIDDAFHFAIEKKLNFSIFWELANYLSQETDYIAWYPMFKAFEFISNVFAFMEFYPGFKEVQKSLKFINIHTKINKLLYIYILYNSNVEDDRAKSLNQELAKWECIIDDIPCKRGNLQLLWHLEDPEEHKFSPEWKTWIYCNGLKQANTVTWKQLLYLYENNFDRTILECLICSKNSTIIIDYLNITLPKLITISEPHYLLNLSSEQKRARERAYALTANIFLSTLARNTKHMFNDILKNFGKIKHERVSEITALTVMINNMYSKEQLTEINKFVKKDMIEPISELVELKIATRLSEIERQTKYLQSLFNGWKN